MSIQTSFTRFPSSILEHVQSFLSLHYPEAKVSFNEFIDPTSNQPTIDLDYISKEINEDALNTTINILNLLEEAVKNIMNALPKDHVGVVSYQYHE